MTRIGDQRVDASGFAAGAPPELRRGAFEAALQHPPEGAVGVWPSHRAEVSGDSKFITLPADIATADIESPHARLLICARLRGNGTRRSTLRSWTPRSSELCSASKAITGELDVRTFEAVSQIHGGLTATSREYIDPKPRIASQRRPHHAKLPKHRKRDQRLVISSWRIAFVTVLCMVSTHVSRNLDFGLEF